MEAGKLLVKENVVRREPLSARGLAAACALAAAALAAAALVDVALPAPLARDAPPHRFIADIAHDHLVNLTSIGPRVAGSYENEVLGVGVVVGAVRAIARGAGPHVRLDLHVQTASGAFPLGFLDGMNHVYQDVSNVAVRVSAAGGRHGAGAGEARNALLLNCHIDTVPDSPGASDDGAGCAVLLETLRALAAARSPPRRAAIFLFNGAEENVLQASHGFITHHKYVGPVGARLHQHRGVRRRRARGAVPGGPARPLDRGDVRGRGAASLRVVAGAGAVRERPHPRRHRLPHLPRLRQPVRRGPGVERQRLRVPHGAGHRRARRPRRPAAHRRQRAGARARAAGEPEPGERGGALGAAAGVLRRAGRAGGERARAGCPAGGRAGAGAGRARRAPHRRRRR